MREKRSWVQSSILICYLVYHQASCGLMVMSKGRGEATGSRGCMWSIRRIGMVGRGGFHYHSFFIMVWQDQLKLKYYFLWCRNDL